MPNSLQKPKSLPNGQIPKISDYNEWIKQIGKRLDEHPFDSTNPSIVIVGDKDDSEALRQANDDLIKSGWSVRFTAMSNVLCLIVSHPSFVPPSGIYD